MPSSYSVVTLVQYASGCRHRMLIQTVAKRTLDLQSLNTKGPTLVHRGGGVAPNIAMPDYGSHPGWSVADECSGWLNGTLDTWADPAMPRFKNPKSGGFTSQSAQDRWLYERLFAKLGRRGTYVDVAANHFKRISNTFFFDRCLGWKGLCVEPNPIYHDGLRRHRTCALVDTCASNTTSAETRELVMPREQWLGGMGGVAGGTLDHWARRAFPQSQWAAATSRMRCVRLGDELERRGLTRVDLLSLDVEGHVRSEPSKPRAWCVLCVCVTLAKCPNDCVLRAWSSPARQEEHVLRGIDFERVRIDHILCEAGCEAVLRPLGYVTTKQPGQTGTELLYSRPRGRVSWPGAGS
jgi:hypothetical protein